MRDTIREIMPRMSHARAKTAWAIGWNTARAATAVLLAVATADQIRLAIVAAHAAGVESTIAIDRLLSFFTVQSNLLAMLVLAWAAVHGFASRGGKVPRTLGVALAAVTTYMVVTGVVYNAVLRSAGGTDIMQGWSNQVHHVIGPLFLAIDAVIAPGLGALPWRSLWIVIAFPVIWAAVTLARGPFVTSPSTGHAPWYPYPFLDPTTTIGGYAGVAAWIAGIAVVIAGAGALVLAASRYRRIRSGSPSVAGG